MASITNLSISDEEEELEIPIEDTPNNTADTSATLVGKFLTENQLEGT